MDPDKVDIRESGPGEFTGIEQLCVDAFPDEDLLPLVKDLLRFGTGVISLVAIYENEVAGHICFTFCTIEDAKDKVALLGPLAVSPALQKQGIGSRLVETGLKRLESAGIGDVFVLGDPRYYSRFGFKADDEVTPPYPLPKEWHGAWQSIRLRAPEAPVKGKLTVPEPWRKSALWTS